MRALVCCFCLFAALGWGQTFTASVRGTVTDSTQAAVPSAKITATDVDRNVAYSRASDTAGRYIFPTLRPAIRSCRGLPTGLWRHRHKNQRRPCEASYWASHRPSPQDLSEEWTLTS